VDGKLTVRLSQGNRFGKYWRLTEGKFGPGYAEQKMKYALDEEFVVLLGS
jgi:hypothetical protein